MHPGGKQAFVPHSRWLTDGADSFFTCAHTLPNTDAWDDHLEELVFKKLCSCGSLGEVLHQALGNDVSHGL